MKNLVRINLAPSEELENPYWYIPDLATFILVGLISYFIVDASLQKIREEIEVAQIQGEELRQQNNMLKSKIKRYDELNVIKADLTKKRDAVEKITSSKLDRYLPVIILESIQNLKPEGIWLNSIAFMNTDETVEENSSQQSDKDSKNKDAEASNQESKDENYNLVKIEGQGFDNMLIAEFILNLKSTFNQDPEASDLRSLVYFDDMIIHNTTKSSRDLSIEQKLESDPTKILLSKYSIDINTFSISFKFKERESNRKEIDLRISNILSNMNKNKRL